MAPSILEAFGQVAIEAGSCGVPTIGFKNTGLEDTIQHEKTGYLCEYLNQNDFNKGLLWMIEKINKNRNYFESSCISFVKRNFSSEIIAQKYKSIYESIFNKMKYSNNFFSIILIGGMGSRFSKINEAPKQLIKINKRSLLENLIISFINNGINNFCFTAWI